MLGEAFVAGLDRGLQSAGSFAPSKLPRMGTLREHLACRKKSTATSPCDSYACDGRKLEVFGPAPSRAAEAYGLVQEADHAKVPTRSTGAPESLRLAEDFEPHLAPSASMKLKFAQSTPRFTPVGGGNKLRHQLGFEGFVQLDGTILWYH